MKDLPLVDTCSEMIEGVGHEFMDDFFGCCESLLAKDGIFVLQVLANDCKDTHINLTHVLG
jgi:cyclopropane fatty-acyl-phospholipid synthase-like methyltransferase